MPSEKKNRMDQLSTLLGEGKGKRERFTHVFDDKASKAVGDEYERSSCLMALKPNARKIVQ